MKPYEVIPVPLMGKLKDTNIGNKNLKKDDYCTTIHLSDSNERNDYILEDEFFNRVNKVFESLCDNHTIAVDGDLNKITVLFSSYLENVKWIHESLYHLLRVPVLNRSREDFRLSCHTLQINSHLLVNSAEFKVPRFNDKESLGDYLLYYQPQVCTKSFKITGTEVLVRKLDRRGKILSPLEFISSLEKTGDITHVGKWIINKAYNQFNKIIRAEKDFTLSINLSAVQLKEDELVKYIHSCTRLYGIQPSQVQFELTESITANTEQSIKNLIKLKKMGFNIALDDFGTGFSSLSYLDLFPIDTLKLDKSFISRVVPNKNYPVLEAIINLASELNLKIVAEGVESVHQLNYLSQKKCDLVQGFLFSRPLPFESFVSLFDKSKVTPNWF